MGTERTTFPSTGSFGKRDSRSDLASVIDFTGGSIPDLYWSSPGYQVTP